MHKLVTSWKYYMCWYLYLLVIENKSVLVLRTVAASWITGQPANYCKLFLIVTITCTDAFCVQLMLFFFCSFPARLSLGEVYRAGRTGSIILMSLAGKTEMLQPS